MERKIVSGIMLTLLLVGMSILAFNIQPVKSELRTNNWPLFHKDERNSGFGEGKAPDDNRTFWIVSGVGGYQSIPVVDHGRVFVGSVDGKVNAIDIETGVVEWSFQTGPHVDQPPRLALDSDMVFVGSYPDKTVYALNQMDGTLVWQFNTAGVIGCASTVYKDILYVCCQGPGIVYALNTSSGAEIWHQNIGTWITTVPAVSEGKVFVGEWGGPFFALNATTGNSVWNISLGLTTSPSVVNGRIFVMQQSSNTLFALNESNGNVIWSFSGIGGGVRSAGTPAVAYGKVFLDPTQTTSVYAFDEETGSLIWESQPGPFEATEHAAGSIAVADQKVFACIPNRIYALDASTGSTLWSYYLGDPGDYPAVAYGLVLVGAGNNLYAIGSEYIPLQYNLTVYSSPTGVTFTVDGVSRTTPWSGTYSEGISVSLVMPTVHTVGDAKYYFAYWSDGSVTWSRAVTMNANITITAIYYGPYYELTVASSPITRIRFSLNGIWLTAPFTKWWLEGRWTLEMPETYNGYVWSHWLEDGDTNRTKTFVLTGNTTWTGVFRFLADLNGDGIVDISDVVIAALAFGSIPGEPNWNPDADLNNDGQVDIFDLIIISVNFGKKG